MQSSRLQAAIQHADGSSATDRILRKTNHTTRPLFTSLRSLTLYVDAYDPIVDYDAAQWHWMAREIREGLPAPHISTLTIIVSVAHAEVTELDRIVCWSVMDELNVELAKDRYGALGMVEFVVERAPGWTRRQTAAEEALMVKIQRTLHNLVDAGKLVVRYGRYVCSL